MIAGDDFFKKPQKDIIESQGKNLIVSASAGSGKTTVMIAKILELLLDGKAHINSLLVLTYTTSAATEMKQKLLGQLKIHAQKYEFLEQEIEDLDIADISTIHSFCSRIIKKYFHILDNVDPSFTILCDEQTVLLKDRAIKQTLKYFKHNYPNEYLKILKMYGKTRNDEKIIDIVLKINDYLDSILDKENFRQKIAFTLYDDPQKAMQILNDSLCESLQGFAHKSEILRQKGQQQGSTDAQEMACDMLGILEQIKPQNKFLKNIEILASSSFMTKKRKIDNQELIDQIVNLREQVTKLKKKIRSKNYSFEMEKSFQTNREILKWFLFLQKKFEQFYLDEKKQAGGMDYCDLERNAITIVQNQQVADELRAKYQQVFIDEFQDANQVQETLISAISRPNNRFMVGDVKQSIYAFRQSNPQIFLDIENAYRNQDQSECRQLNLNFRSDKTILDFVNHVFSCVMTEQTAGIDYKKNSLFEPNVTLEQNDLPRVKINLIKQQEKQEKKLADDLFDILQEDDESQELSVARKEAYCVAQDIKKLKNHFLFESDHKTKRGVQFGDMAILVRKRGKYFDEFCSTLSLLGVPLFASSNKNMFEQGDVLKLVGLLKLSQCLYDDNSLAAVMTSLIGNFTYQELADIKIAFPEKKYFYESVIEYSKNSNDDLSQKIVLFLKMIEDFGFSCQVKGIYLSLTELLDKTEYLTKIQAMPQGSFRAETIQKFTSLFKNEFDFNLADFLVFASVKNSLKSPSQPISETDCVTITTIHSSKGLEYPIVFVVQGGADLTKSPVQPEVRISDKLGVGLKFYDEENSKKSTSFVYDAIEQTATKQEFAESLRLLYVGLTRAKEYLYIYGTTNDYFSMENSQDIFAGKTYLDFIMGSFEQQSLQEILGQKQTFIKKSNLLVEFQFFNSEDFDKDENTQPISVFSLGDEKTEKQIEQSMFFAYPKPEVYSVALKNSVSSLLEKEDYASQNFAPKNLTIDENLIEQATVLGSAYHKIFQFLTFERADKDMVEKLIEKYIPIEIACQIDVQKILDVVELVSPLVKNQILQKERKFIMRVPYNSVIDSELDDLVLIQGVIDMFSLGKHNVLIDYKLTSLKNDEQIKNNYSKQIELYKKALIFAFGSMEIDCYIVDINRGKLIQM